MFSRQEAEDRRVRQEVSIITEDIEDDEGVKDESEIWEVTNERERELETTQGRVWIYYLNSWRWWDGHRLTTRRRRRTCLDEP